MVQSATRLFQQLSASGDVFTRYLLPGLPEARIDDILADADLPPLPPDARAFYRAFNLVKHYQYGPDQPTFFGIYWLLSFEDAVESLVERSSYDFLEPRWRESFPLLQEDGNVYLIDREVDENGNYQIVHDFVGLDPTPAFANATSMFDTFGAWLTTGALPAAGGRVPGDYEGDEEMVRAVAERFNPGIHRWTAKRS